MKALPEDIIVAVIDGPTTGNNGNAWYGVRSQGQTGWVDGSYLAASGPPAPSATATAPVGGLGPGATAMIIRRRGLWRVAACAPPRPRGRSNLTSSRRGRWCASLKGR